MSIKCGFCAERMLSVPQLTLILSVVLAVFTIIFGFWTATSVWSFPQFLVALVVLIYWPGKLLLDAAGLSLTFLEDLMLALLLGITSSSLLYWCAAFLAVPTLFFFWPLVAAVKYFYRRRMKWREIYKFRLALKAHHWLLAGVMILGLFPLAILSRYYPNVARLPQDQMTFSTVPDVILHLSVANELTHSIPPQAPFLAGAPLGYHYGMDLLAAMFSASAGLSVLDLTVRFIPTLFIIVTILAIFCFSRAWLHSPYAAVLATFLVIFGEDLSFVPALALGSKLVWSKQFFAVPTTFSLYYINPMLPALGILFGGLFCLLKYCREDKKAWLISTAFFFAILWEYKNFAAMHILASLAVASFIYLVFLQDKRLLKVLVLAALLIIPLVLYSWFSNQAGGKQWVRIDPYPYVPNMLSQLGWLNTSWGSRVNALFGGGSVTPSGLAAFFIVALPVYLLGSLGLRAIAVPAVFKEFHAPAPSTVLRFLLAVFVVLGFLLTLTFRITPLETPSAYNNAVWFYVQSKYVIWIFVVELIAMLWRDKRFLLRALILISVVGLSVPSTLQYFDNQLSAKIDVLDQNEHELITFFNQNCLHGEVVFSRQEMSLPIVALTKCRVPVVDRLFEASFVSLAELAQRHTDRNIFWEAWGKGDLRVDILERYKAVYVVVDRRIGDMVPDTLLGVNDSARSAAGQISLRLSFENGYFKVYQVWR